MNNYIIQYETAVLYVMPNKESIKPVSIFPECLINVGTTSAPQYVARFRYDNPNRNSPFPVPIFVPAGNNNSVTGAVSGFIPIMVFNEGSGFMDVPFGSNSTSVTWILTTASNGKLRTFRATVSRNSTPCSPALITRTSTDVQTAGSVTLQPENDQKGISIMVSPNPAVGIIRISSPTGSLQAGEIQLYDMSGRAQASRRTSQVNSSLVEMDISPLPPGMYLIRARAEGRFQTLKLLKQ
jgi:hypothetical protein